MVLFRMKYCYCVMAILALLSACSEKISPPEPDVTDEIVVTAEALDITETKATLCGYMIKEIEEEAEFGIVYTSSKVSSLEKWHIENSPTLGDNKQFSITVSNLIPNTTYYYRAYYSCDGKVRYGEENSFKTLDYDVSVSTGYITALSDGTSVNISATLNGTLRVRSIEDIEKSVGFYYSDKEYSVADMVHFGSLFEASLDEDNNITGTVSPLRYNTTYYYVAFALVYNKKCYGEVKSFTTPSFTFSEIDMGLSVKWANTNLGAEIPVDLGDCYAWGEIETKEEYSLQNYKWYDTSGLTKYDAAVDNLTTLEPADDAAHVILGGTWRMPTKGELEELYATRGDSNYSWSYIDRYRSDKEERGWLVTYLVNHNDIFLPVEKKTAWAPDNFFLVSYYWSTASSKHYQAMALELEGLSKDWIVMTEKSRFEGSYIRPVSE